MVYRNFRFNCLWRILLIVAAIYFLFYVHFSVRWYVTTFIVLCFLIYLIYDLFYFVDTTNRDMTLFLYAIKSSDFSQTFKGAGLSSSFMDLKTAYNEVLAEFHKTRAEKEEHYRYLQTVVQHVGIGLVAFFASGDVELINNSAKRILNITSLKKIQGLENISKTLVEKLIDIRTGERALIKIEQGNELQQLSIYATEFKLRNQNIKLVSIQNIQSELEEKEMEAWQNLIRVLTHEIMNSVTPISSLASTISTLISTGEIQEDHLILSADSRSDITEALQTIEKRSEGLLHFVDSYRNLTRIPKPNFKIVPVKTLFDQVQMLMQNKLKENNIDLIVVLNPEDLELTCDPELISQILINIVLNAIQAFDNQPQPKITMEAYADDRSRVVIKITDNGPGILPEVIAKIFIPFFTTKRSGSGIGLSLSRQIMRMHRGTICAQSEPNVYTTFTLRF